MEYRRWTPPRHTQKSANTLMHKPELFARSMLHICHCLESLSRWCNNHYQVNRNNPGPAECLAALEVELALLELIRDIQANGKQTTSERDQ